MSRTSSALTASRLFRAGAGAGKTTTLVREVIRLAAEFEKGGGRPPRVIVTTFTRKATQELKERLLEEGIRSDSEALLHFVTTPSLLMISTIHGVLAQFLSQMSGALGLDAEFRLVDEMQADRKWKSALRRLLIQDARLAELLERFTFSQLAKFARSYVMRAVSGISPAPLDEAAIWLDVRQSIQSFCAEVHRCAALLTAPDLSPAWKEIQSILRRLSNSAEECQTVELWTQARTLWVELGEAIVLPRGKVRKEVDELTCDALKALKGEIDQFSELDFDPVSWAQMTTDAAILNEVGQRLADVWKQEKLESGELSIEDLEVLSLCLLKEFPDTGAQFSEQWDYWFVDEYQDTSPSQVALLKSLIGQAGHFVVGDPQQSIYFFRGARSEVFFQKEREFQDQGISIEYLKTNRRSRPTLLHFFNDFFRSVSSDQFQAMEPNPTPREETATTRHADPMAARFFFVPERNQELDAVVWQLRAWANLQIPLKDMAVLTRTHKDLHDIADRLHVAGIPTQVISAGGFYDRREVLDALCLLRFLVNPSDDVNVLALVRSPWLHLSDELITEYLNARASTPVWEQLKRIETAASVPQGSFASGAGSVSGTGSAFGGVRDNAVKIISTMRTYLVRAQAEGVSAIFREALEGLGFFAFCHVHDVTGMREANLWKLVQKLKQEEHRAGFSLVEFIAKARAGLEDGLEQNDGDAVSAFEPNRVMLMTVHASKGLGIPYVILPFIQKDTRPSRRDTFLYDEAENRWLTASPTPDGSAWMYPPPTRRVMNRIQELESEEHLRLLYVALTRARENVMLTSSGKVGKNSWHNAIGIDITEGVHGDAHYSYEVLTSVPELVELTENGFIADIVAPRNAWREPSVGTVSRPSQTTLVYPQAVRAQSVGPRNAVHLRARLEAVRRGIRVHKLLEILVRRKSTDLKDLNLNSADPDVALVQRSVQYLLTQTQIPYGALILDGHAEWGFIFRHKGEDVRGQIDLWGMVGGVAWIIDYKTGQFEFREDAFEQMRVYAQALRAHGVLGPIRTAAVYPLVQKMEIRDGDFESDKLEESRLYS